MSQINTFFIPLTDTGERQDEMNAFLRGHRVLQIERAFAVSGWAFCVEWLEGEDGVAKGKWRERKIAYREVLEPAVFARFAVLREKRKSIAQQEGIPPYMVMTDAQLAEAAKPEALTESHLRSIEGFGEARVKKYAQRLISAIQGEMR